MAHGWPDFCKWTLLGASIALIFCVSQAHAWTPRKPILHGDSARPFPTFFHLDYPLCRAEAWLKALAMGAQKLPAAPVFTQAGLRGRLARLALAGIHYPVDVVTPPNSPGREIRVFLKESGEMFPFVEHVAQEPLPFLLKMCLVWEIADACAKLRKIWPNSVEEARKNNQALEKLGARLRQLWHAWHAPSQAILDDDASAAILLQKAYDNRNNGRGAAYADKAVRILLAREVSPDGSADAQLWNQLAAHAIYLRALGEERQAQPALAETDYSATITRLKKSGLPDRLAARALDARAALRSKRGNIAGMCADYLDACGLGHCQGLASARREGQCLE